jgi:peptidoglycan/LPS O-acetylase OafA/YrhL
MKARTIFIVMICIIVTISVGAWMYFSMDGAFKLADITQVAIIIVLVAFALLIGIRRLGSARRGEPVEDELSRKIMQKAAASSYYLSLYWWLLLIYLSDDLEMETGTMIGTGILGMAILLALSWLYFKLKGVRS